MVSTDETDASQADRRRFASVLALVALVGVAIRALTVSVPLFGDESCTTIANITQFFRSRTIIPADVIYPTLYSYLSAAVLATWSLVLVIAGKAHSLAGAGLLFITDQAPFLEPLRLMTVAFDAGNIVAAGLLGARLRDRRTGIVAAVFVALSVNHLRYARWALPDVPMALFATLSALAALETINQPRWRWYLLSGAMAGLATSCKYNAALVTSALAAAHVMAPHAEGMFLAWRNLRKLGAAAAMCIAAFLVTSPVWVLRTGWCVTTFRETVEHMAGGHHFVPGGPPFTWVLNFVVCNETTIGCVALAGIVYAAVRHRKREIAILVPVVLTSFLVGTWQKQSSHYLLGIWPLLLALGAVLASDVAQRAPWPKAMLTTIMVVVLVLPMRNACRFVAESRRVDNRVLAERWIQTSIPGGTHVAVDWGYMPGIYDIE